MRENIYRLQSHFCGRNFLRWRLECFCRVGFATKGLNYSYLIHLSENLLKLRALQSWERIFLSKIRATRIFLFARSTLNTISSACLFSTFSSKWFKLTEHVLETSMNRAYITIIFSMILPIWLMFFLSIFVFYLPTDACEKMTLSISILIGQTVFLTLLAKVCIWIIKLIIWVLSTPQKRLWKFLF